jgi:hypothetical protein
MLPPKSEKKSLRSSVAGKLINKSTLLKEAFREWQVDLSNKGLGDNNVNEVCRNMKTNPSLNMLNLSGNKFTDEGI